ncbi:MAG: ABC transporter permease [bacterium]
MDYQESLLVSLEGLKAHKLRAFLTLLGIIFGVAAVIAMLSIGEGAKQEALEQIALMGINNIIIYDRPISDIEEGTDRSNLSMGLKLADAKAVREINPFIDLVIPEKEMTHQVQYHREQIETTIIGTTPDYEQAMNYYAVKGGFFSYNDVYETRRVCALGSGIKRKLFYFRNPIGEQIKIGDQWFTVIGVMEHKAVSVKAKDQFKVRDMNFDIYIPISSALKRYTHQPFESELDRLIVRVKEASYIHFAANIINKVMDRRHHGVDDYHITIPEELMRQSQATQRIFNIVMGCIAGISLLVGGIGIMNIMLASILERTREIGVRRAVGATQKDIMGQFLFEAIVLTLVGGLVGIILGFSLTKIITLYANWRTIVSLPAIILAFGVSASVGVLFGFYPARKAARLDPIESLRYE